ncbi:hypothetical protein ACTI_00290 [Actinoplanes sp. OR16]|uniref:hypothetical protein n=1 Tax=Actinoplanes sp. OR16 TaxID=946334 RepID=UPI000F7087F5|nr:hypothetical protein [Actinoplanes sp. OR16]BBH63344.1 hypothetical protein ACTI_00290 [Actinoplanes sp. OR16]
MYGAASREYLFGGSGSDYIEAGAGDELIYGDNPTTGLKDPTDTGAAGNDTILAGTGSVSAEGGPGNDIVWTRGGGSSAGRSSESVYGGPGNDVLIGTGPSGYGYFYGNAGSDVIMPPMIRANPLGNVVYGGDGGDLIFTMNLLRDHVNFGELKTSVTVPLGTSCKVTVAWPANPKPGDSGKFTCSLPVSVKIPGLIDGVTVSASVDAAGKTTGKVDYTPAKELKTVQAIANVVRNGGFPTDICVCDPKLPGWAKVVISDDVFK